ncbi:MAG TPA: hypothetical protein VKP68_08265, partial [Ramlibacter sp.]|nr:hypothetical protein [Ramlibacter sp.]
GEEIAAIAIGLMKKVRRPGQAVRLIGVGVSGLGEPARQLSLWDLPSEKAQRLEQAIAELKKRYGDGVIGHGG